MRVACAEPFEQEAAARTQFRWTNSSYNNLPLVEHLFRRSARGWRWGVGIWSRNEVLQERNNSKTGELGLLLPRIRRRGVPQRFTSNIPDSARADLVRAVNTGIIDVHFRLAGPQKSPKLALRQSFWAFASQRRGWDR